MSERAESYDELRAEIDRLKAENEKYHQAIGLATTALPSMQIDPNDPVGMMHKVVAQITALRAELERMDKKNRVLH
ncbi:MAG TPA: hypothetical protein P5244_11040, partial [Syntrophales bacterium]|nr:hypothetical protein [Syntrophales bacterium]